MVRRLPLLFVWIVACATVLAQPAEPGLAPTIPPRDHILLARELLGVTAPPHVPQPLADVGDRRTFYAMDIMSGERRRLDAELVAAGAHVTLWVETSVSVNLVQAQALVRQFDEVVYPEVRALWGSEDSPGIDGDPRLMIVFVDGVGSGTAAYYSSNDRYPSSIVPFSSEADLFFVSTALAAGRLDRPQVVATLAHEFQHMIRDHRGEHPQTWLNEGLSTFTELALGMLQVDWVFSAFQRNPGIQLTNWSLADDRSAHYGAAGLFVAYVAERYGREGVTALAAGEGPGLAPVRAMLGAVDPNTDAETLLADWVAANYIRGDGSDVYGYRTVTLSAPAAPRMELGSTVEVDLPPYATAYRTLDPGDATSIAIDISADSVVSMLPTEAVSGNQFWATLRADDSTGVLEREFDLTDVTAAELTYALWHDLEDNYDYLLLTATADGGATWQVLAPAFAADSPYGPALTGESGGWRKERISLAAYAGQSVRLRWLVVTDDALTEPGVALDDIAVDAIGYFDDGEGEASDWAAAGWVLTDNRIEASVWVQVVQHTSAGIRVDRQRVYGSGRLEVEVDPDASDVAIAITPLADMTTEPIAVALTVR